MTSHSTSWDSVGLGEAGEKATTAITDALWRLMRSRGWGTIREVQRAMNKRKNWIYKARDRGMKISEVVDVLAVLGEPPGPFFASVFGDGPTTAGDRFRSGGANLIARGIVDLPELASPTRPDTLTKSEFDALDRARFEDPRAAADQGRGLAFLAASEGRQGDATACAARWGSALRASEQWHQAHAVVCWALNHAPEGPILADLWRRAASVTADYGNFDDAAELARLSMAAFAELGDFVGAARSLLTRGIHLRRAGQSGAAIRCLRTATSSLPSGDLGHFSSHLTMGQVYADVENFRAAESHADLASSFEAPRSGLILISRLRARIAAGRGDYGEAIRLYREVVVAFANLPGDAALVGAKLARVYIQAGRVDDAVETARGLAAFAMPSRANRVVSAAIRDMWCSAAAGEMTVDALDRFIARIRRGQDRRAAPAARMND